MAKTDSLSEKQLLEEILKTQKRTLLGTRIATAAVVIMCAAVCISLGILVPKVTKTLDDVNAAIERTESLVESAEKSLSEIDGMIANVNTLVVDNTESLEEAVNNLNSVNFDELNQAIQDLGDVVEPLANFVNKFR